jgi:GT2 family glycosyltransferase
MDPQPPATDPSPLATGTASGTAFDIAPADRGPIGAGRGIAVIIVNYRTAELTALGVESVLARRHGGRPVEVHVVENASPGGEDARLLSRWHAERGWGARVTLWLETENHGFGRGNNVVLRALAKRATPPEYVMLLNPDARLDNEAIAVMAEVMDTNPRIAMTGAGIAKPDGTAVTAAFRFPSAISELAQAANFGPIRRLFENRVVSLPPDHPRGPVGWVAGAAVLMRFEAIRAVNFFDPAYFLYFEEVDLMLQVSRAGGEIWFVPEARVIHAEGAATGVRSAPERRRRPSYWYRSWRHYYTKNHGRGGAIMAGTAWIAGAAVNGVLAPLRGQQLYAPARFHDDFWGIVMRPLLGLQERIRD